jgi:hypothetical protein
MTGIQTGVRRSANVPSPVESTVVRRVRLSWRRGSLVLFVALLATVHLWIVTGGRWNFAANPSGTLYGRQAAAFLAGQLALLESPPDALLALPDPYDGRAWLRIMTTPDLSLYGDRFYLYFGPFPAVVFAALALVGLRIPDGMLGLAFDIALVPLFGTALAFARQRFAPAGSWALDRLMLLAFGLAAPLLFMLGRLSVYETAIAGGQALLLFGLSLGLAARATGAGWWLSLAGLALGLAAATRLSLLPALVVVAFLLAALQRQRRRAIVALLGPLVALVALLGVYNAARFGSPFETGLQYAITTLPHRAWLPSMFAIGNLPVTLAWYGWRPPTWSWGAPFILPGRVSADEWVPLQGWYFEPWGMTGLIWFSPILVVGLGASLVASARRKRGVLFVLGLWLAAGLAAAPVLLYRALYWRYFVDFLPLALLASGLAVQLVLPRQRGRRGLLAGVGLLVAWGGLVGIATGIAAHNAWAGFAERDGLVARVARQVPAVAAVANALDWIGERSSERTVALIAEPLPGTPATIDIGSPAHVDVALADPVGDPCWAILPGPGVDYLLADRPLGSALARVVPAFGPPVFVSRAPAPLPPPLEVGRERAVALCPVAVDGANAATFGADFVRRWRSRAFRGSGAARYQSFLTSGPFRVRVLAYGIPGDGAPPVLRVEAGREGDGGALGAERLVIDSDYFYRWYEADFTAAAGPVSITLRYDDDGRWRPWWAISLARVEVVGR